jgi:acyl-CoA synthetase (NDP forming)
MAADAAATARLSVPELSPVTQATLRAMLAAGAAVANPVDLVASAGPAEYAAALESVLSDDAVDAVVVIFTPTLVADPDEVARVIAVAGAAGDKPVLAALITREGGLLPAAGDAGHRVPCFAAAEEAVLVLGHLADHAAWRERADDPPAEPEGIDRHRAGEILHEVLAPGAGRWLDPLEAVALLTTYGIPCTRTEVVATADDAVAVAEALGYPVALKVGGFVVHKTELGGVRLGLGSPEAVRAAYDSLAALPEAGAGIVVQPMAAPGVETIAGITNDPTFGPLVLFGLGGTTAELLDDRTIRLVPLSRRTAGDMVRSLRGSPLLTGYRGSQAVDTARLEDVLVRLAKLAADHPEIAEADLNPLIATPDGVVAVDAKIRIRPVPPSLDHLRHLAPPRPAPTNVR